MTHEANTSLLRHHQLTVEGVSVHVVEGGPNATPVVFFLHGWPESWAAFEHVMLSLADSYHVVAIDLPGVGKSVGAPSANDKRTLAGYVKGVIDALGLRDVTLVGHDVGGQIVYGYLHRYPETLCRAIIMNVAVPGVEPWSEVVRNPYIWHFAFHSIPDLPERLVAGKEADYFGFFYGVITAGADAVPAAQRQRFVAAYTRPEALHVGFEWYRAFAQDERDNLSSQGQPVSTPLLYLRGEAEAGELEAYLRGFREGGLRHVEGRIIPGMGHWLDENPAGVLAALKDFLNAAA